MPLSTNGRNPRARGGEALQRSWLVKYTALSQPHLRALEDVQHWEPSHVYAGQDETSGDLPTRRDYPRFSDNEVVLGHYLGAGAFGVVHAVQGIRPSQNETELGRARQEPQRYADTIEHEEHYNVHDAKHRMASSVQRQGKPRYAVKRLIRSLSPAEAERGRADLAVEATLLSTLWHPNIIRMRGIRDGDNWQDPNFFIVLDCLNHTLVQEIDEWKKRRQTSGGSFLCCGGDAERELIQKELLFERLMVARDLSSALVYLHKNNVVYRDLKQENVGFDVRQNVKLFDFGISKALHPGLRNKGKEGGYLLTPCTGSLPTMAPEVVLGQPYDQSCDVYSFGILLWEFLALKPAFHLFSPPEYKTRVVQGKLRPSLGSPRDGFTPVLSKMLQQAWDDQAKTRPSMAQVKTILQVEQTKINFSGKSSPVMDRTKHLQNLSMVSVVNSRRASFQRQQKSSHTTISE